MSMDEVMVALRTFERQLDQLTTTMQGSVKSLEQEHDRISDLWRDSFSAEYQWRWSSFDTHMHDYLQRDAPKYRSFLSLKIRQLATYLGHG
jgi:uncharacterized protein YukE